GRPGAAALQHRCHGAASGGDLPGGRTGLPRRAAARSGRLASLRQARHSRQHHPDAAAGQIARTQSDRKHLAVHTRQLALQPDIPVLRRYPRPLLPRLEQAGRPALDDHVHRLARLGASVLISESWYYTVKQSIGTDGSEGPLTPTGDIPASVT